MNKSRFYTSKFILLLLLVVIAAFGHHCYSPDYTESPNSDPNNGGNGEYGFDVVTPLPQTFNCNDSGYFRICIQPEIENIIGNNRLWFELEKDNNDYRSNYASFPSGSHSSEYLEWGGSLPSGTYWVTACMINIQLDAGCEDSICESYGNSLGFLEVTECAQPQRVMDIEYFCQISDTSIIDRYDVFLSPNTAAYMDIAFNAANTACSVTTYDTDLPSELILNDKDSIKNYIFNHKQSEDRMFLCGIKGFKGEYGNFMQLKRGITMIDTNTFSYSKTTGSIVAVKTCINYASISIKVDYNDWVTAVTIHELGHQRGIGGHHEAGYEPRFCIMNPGLSFVGNNTDYNPHFCEECLDKIRNFPIWGGRR
jgi:predicted Zn-dependent protease